MPKKKTVEPEKRGPGGANHLEPPNGKVVRFSGSYYALHRKPIIKRFGSVQNFIYCSILHLEQIPVIEAKKAKRLASGRDKQ